MEKQERTVTEIQIQAEIWTEIWKRHIAARRMLFHVPNESTYNNSQQASSGVIPGVPDLMFAWCGITWYIELKDDEGRVSDAQKVFHSQLDNQKIKVYVFYSAAPAIDFLEAIILGMSPALAVVSFASFVSPFSDGSKYDYYLSEWQRKKKARRGKK